MITLLLDDQAKARATFEAPPHDRMPIQRIVSHLAVFGLLAACSFPAHSQTLQRHEGFALWVLPFPSLTLQLRLEGDSIFKSDQPTIVAVDGTPVQVLVVDPAQFTKATKEEEILTDHLTYETDYMRETLQLEAVYKQEMVRLGNKHHALMWSYMMPKREALDPGSEAVGQLFLDLVLEGRVVGLNITLFAENDPEAKRAQLLRIANAITVLRTPANDN